MEPTPKLNKIYTMYFTTVVFVLFLIALYSLNIHNLTPRYISKYVMSLKWSSFENSVQHTYNTTTSISKQNITDIKTIVFFNKPVWLDIKGMNDALNRCEISNCEMTNDRSQLAKHPAILFSLTAEPALPKVPPIPPKERNSDQVWIFLWLEPPPLHTGGNAMYKTAPWRDTANWTMSYTRDADIHFPNSYISRRDTPTAKNYSQIYRRKTRMAAWIVSNCQTQSKRNQYVNMLRKHGIEVDIFGKCGKERISAEKVASILNGDYKFYLSFENSFCQDYITEKFYKYLTYDIVLIVRGAADYSSLVPRNTIIDTTDYESVKHLADYMKVVAANESLYMDYLRNKDMFEVVPQNLKALCTMCEKLNNLEKNRRVYTDLVDKINNKTCY